ncbi:glycerol-3-phosphate 1-O-acyltransferase PlsY [Megalodesulfovibrio gigas]|nr:glycerol-3-phosphate 1-O-acyltransferase PlsY [Megalodesulfovibrio gigas]
MWIIMIAGAYVLGSIPFGLLIAKSFCGVDPRTQGSGNIGATNVARLCGTHWGVAAMILDMAKGFLPVLVVWQLGAETALVSLVAFAALLGHVYSIFLKFKGGKAVATTLGIFAALAPWHCLGAAAVCVAAIAVSGYVSLGSLGLVTALPVLLAVFGRAELVPLALAVAALVFWRHRENIGRLRRGEETSWRKR